MNSPPKQPGSYLLPRLLQVCVDIHKPNWIFEREDSWVIKFYPFVKTFKEVNLLKPILVKVNKKNGNIDWNHLE